MCQTAKRATGTTRSGRSAAMVAAVIAAVLAAVAVAPPAAGQGTRGVMPDPIDSRDFDRFAEALGLSESQVLAATEFHARYLQEFQALRDGPIQEYLDEHSGRGFDRDCAEMQAAFRETDRVLSQIATADERFLNRLGGLLTDEQAATLPRVRQMRERERLRSGSMRAVAWMYPTVRVDLSGMLRDLDLGAAERQAIDATMRNYETQLTGALKRTLSASRDATVAMCEDLAARGFTREAMEANPERFREYFNAMSEAWVATGEPVRRVVADVTGLQRRTLRSLEPQLSARDYEVLRRDFHREAYRNMGTREADAILRHLAALELDGLTTAQRQQVEAALATLRTRDASLAERIMDRLDEDRGSTGPFDRWRRDNDRSEAAREAEALREERVTLHEEANAALREILGEALADAAAERARTLAGADEDRVDGGRRGRRVEVAVRSSDGEVGMVHAGSSEQFDDAFLPEPITRDGFAQLVETLALDDAEAAVAQTLFGEYMAGCQSLRTGVLKQIAEHPAADIGGVDRGIDDDAALPREDEIDALFDLRQQAFDAIATLDAALFDDLALVVPTDDATERMLALRREIRERQRYAAAVQAVQRRVRAFRRFGSMSRSEEPTIDLTALVLSLDLDAADRRAALDVLDDYDRQVTVQLQEAWSQAMAAGREGTKARVRVEQMSRQREETGNWTVGQMREWLRASRARAERAEATAEALTTLNREHMQRLAQALPPEAHGRLEMIYEERAYPQVFDDPSSADRAIRAALQLPDLTEAQRSDLLDVASTYRPAHRDLCRQIVASLREMADLEPIGRDGWRARREQRSATEVIEFQRDELNARTKRRIEAILTAGQAQRAGLGEASS